MTTAAERLASLSKLSGTTAAAMLLAIGSGATAGQALADYSGIPAATAATHLLQDVQVVASEPRGSRKRSGDELTVEEVAAQWELVELRTRPSYPEIPDNSSAVMGGDQNQIKSADRSAATVPGVVNLALPGNYQEILTSSLPTDSAGDPLAPDMAAAAIEAKRMRNNKALALLLMEL